MANWWKQSAWGATAESDPWGEVAAESSAAAAAGGATEDGGTDWGGGNNWRGNQSSAAAADNGTGEAETNAWSKWQKNSATDNADAWQQGADPWGAGAGGSADAWPKPTGKHYWETQKYNIEWGILSRKDETTLQKDDEELFRERLGDSAGLDFTRYDSIPVEVSGEGSQLIPACVSFDDMFQSFGGYVVTELIQNVQRCKYSVPTPVQKYAIPVGLVGRDVMCCAQTGSGKTAAFLIPIIGRMMLRHTDPVGALDVPFEGTVRPDTLIMAPTRELTIQIHQEAKKFCHRTPYLTGLLYGGIPTTSQMADICTGCDVLVATPGRLNDFISREIASVDSVHVLVLDEADRMLDMGLEDAIREIIEKSGMPTSANRQTMMFSATFASATQKLAEDFLYEHIWIGVGIVGGAVDTVEQSLERVGSDKKYEKLIECVDRFYEERDAVEDPKKKPRCMIFCNSKNTCKFLDEQLWDQKFDTAALHGDLTQPEREHALKKFRDGSIDTLIATDVAARGLDIEGVSLVINFDFPQEIDSYVYRIGRTGRIGNKGRALTFLSCDEEGNCLENVETMKSLMQVMSNAKSDHPEWLQGLVDAAATSGGGGCWKWGGKDYRQGKEAYTGTGGGDAWGNWNNNQNNGSASAGDGGDSSWGGAHGDAAGGADNGSGGGGWGGDYGLESGGDDSWEQTLEFISRLPQSQQTMLRRYFYDPYEGYWGAYYVGILKSYSSVNGYGFIECAAAKSDWGADVFVHRNLMPTCWFLGQTVEFLVVPNSRGQPQAEEAMWLPAIPSSPVA